MASPAVTVLLPVRDGEAVLETALDSLLSQTLSDFEILAVDDGSVDATPDILESYAARDSRVRPIRLSRQGLVPALNAGLGGAKGAFIARMDADDACLPQRLELQAAMLLSNPELGLVSCRVRYGGDATACAGYARHVEWINTLTTPQDIALARFQESPLAHPSVMFRAKLPPQHGGYREGVFPEDYELWLRWLEAGVQMAKCEETLLIWNDPPERLSRTDPRYSFDSFYRTKSAYLARWLAKHNPFHPHVWVMGSGRVSRKRADMLLEHGVEIAGYADIDPRKVNKTVHGRPVVLREDMPGPEACFAVSYVASHGAAEDIALFLESNGFMLGKNYILAA